jgi:hypothetical protein
VNWDSEDTERDDKTADEPVVDEEDFIPAAFREPARHVEEDVPEDVPEDLPEDFLEDEDVGAEVDEVVVEDSLDDLALAAAREAISASETALEQAEQATMLMSEPRPGRQRRSWLTKRERVMAVLLLFNIVLMAFLAMAPDLFKPGDEVPEIIRPRYQSPVVNGPDYAPDIRKLDDRYPEDNLYEAAMLASRRGEYPKATRLLKRLLQRTPNMSTVQRRLIYGQLAYNLMRDNRLQEAEEYADRMDRLRVQTTLPEDLVRAARRAYRDGRGRDMRRYYARFLLQQSQVRSDMRDVIAEAYLRIGDSYRLDAEAGEKAQREREAKQRASGGQDK